MKDKEVGSEAANKVGKVPARTSKRGAAADPKDNAITDAVKDMEALIINERDLEAAIAKASPLWENLGNEIRAAAEKSGDRDWSMIERKSTQLLRDIASFRKKFGACGEDALFVALAPHELVAYSSRAEAYAYGVVMKYQNGIDDSTKALEIIKALKPFDVEQYISMLNHRGTCFDYLYGDTRDPKHLNGAIAGFEEAGISSKPKISGIRLTLCMTILFAASSGQKFTRSWKL